MGPFIRQKGVWRPTMVPSGPVKLNSTHLLASGLGGLWLPTPGLGFADWTGNASGGTVSTIRPTWVPGPNGPAAKFNSANSTAIYTNSALPTFNADFTLSAWATRTASSGSNGCVVSTGNRYSRLDVNNTNAIFYVGAYGIEIYGGNVGLNQLFHLVGTRAGAVASLYVNGALIGTSACTTDAQGSQLSIGDAGGAGVEQFDGNISNVAGWDRALNASEVQWLYAEPFAMLVPRTVRRYYAAPSSGGTVVTGSVSESVSATDAPSSAVLAPGSVAEAATATDVPNASATLTASVSEAITATDAPDASVIGGGTVTGSVTEAATATDAPSVTRVSLTAAVAETASATSTASASAITSAGVSEATTATDAPNATAAVPTSVSEATSSADSTNATVISGNPVVTAGVSEALTATDHPDATLIITGRAVAPHDDYDEPPDGYRRILDTRQSAKARRKAEAARLRAARDEIGLIAPKVEPTPTPAPAPKVETVNPVLPPKQIQPTAPPEPKPFDRGGFVETFKATVLDSLALAAAAEAEREAERRAWIARDEEDVLMLLAAVI